MDNLLKIRTSLYDQPISYILTLHKQRLDPQYNIRGTNFVDEFSLCRKKIGACIHMNNLIETYGDECIEHYLIMFFDKKVG